jgi:KaiC/GvpD/RAD55 family RecA-like ATPase
MEDRVQTGVRELDRQLDGGLDRGSAVTLTAPGATQRGTFVRQLLSGREGLYLAPARPVESIKSEEAADGDVAVQPVSPEQPIDDAVDVLNGLPAVDYIVVGTVDVFERQPYARYLSFLKRLQNAASAAESIVLLNALDTASTEKRELTEHLSDVVMELAFEQEGTDLVTRLTVPKVRGRDPPDDVLKLQLGSRVAIDTSRDIA